jgi:hypothetical protein
MNGAAGIAVFGNPVAASGEANTGNAIEGNSIFLNGRGSAATAFLGIDLSNQFPFPTDDGSTPNDSRGHGGAGDPNNFQNFPVLTAAALSLPPGGGTTITGTLTQSTSPNTTFRIELFENPAPFGGYQDPLHLPPEGENFLGFVNVTTNAGGTASFSVTVPGAVSPRVAITATATDPSGNTSEFSPGMTPVPVLSGTGTNIAVTEGTAFSGTVATFADTNPDDWPVLTSGFFTDTITWGDGTTTGGVINPVSGTVGTVSVMGSHTYADEGTFPLGVTLTRQTVIPTSTTTSATATVAEELLPGGVAGTPNQNFLSEVYRDLLHRQIDPLGLRVWGAELEQGADRAAVVEQIMNATAPGATGLDASPEFRKVQVELIYEQYLPGHTAFDRNTRQVLDPTAILVWGGDLAHGTTVEQVAAAVVSSPEFLGGPGGGTVGGFLQALDKDSLGRGLDSLGQEVYGGQLGGDLAAPAAPAAAVAQDVFTSPEYFRHLVDGFYGQLLDRAPGANDNVAFWEGRLAAGVPDEVVMALLVGGNPNSHEYFDKTLA